MNRVTAMKAAAASLFLPPNIYVLRVTAWEIPAAEVQEEQTIQPRAAETWYGTSPVQVGSNLKATVAARRTINSSQWSNSAGFWSQTVMC